MARGLCLSLSMVLSISGCAHFEYKDYSAGGNGVVYYEPEAYLFLKTDYSQQEKECNSTAKMVILPGKKKLINPVSGMLGSSALSVKLDGIYISELGQTSDTKTTDMVGALTGLLPVIGLASLSLVDGGKKTREPTPDECKKISGLYPFVDGKPDFQHPLKISIAEFDADGKKS